jgi:stearoyl-CoA desaturase (delta-9 desaturase)
VGAIWALFNFTWSAFAVFCITYYVSLAWGIGMAYHRLLTHRAYKTSKPIEYFLTICATLALEGGPLFWVATHRQHHQHSDADPDPHTPRHGGFWAHMGWIMFGNLEHNDVTRTAKYAPDLAKDGFHRWISKYHWVPLTLLGLTFLAFGRWDWVLWGVFLRTTIGLHVTWLVNSATHLWGARRFETRDDSRNNWWVAILSFGEGWHNNHHAHPTSAAHGLVVRARHHLLAHPRARGDGPRHCRASRAHQRTRRKSSVVSRYVRPSIPARQGRTGDPQFTTNAALRSQHLAGLRHPHAYRRRDLPANSDDTRRLALGR